MRSIEGDLGSQKVVEGGEYDGIHPSAKRRDPAGTTGDDEPRPDAYGIINAHLFPLCSPFFMCCMIHIYSQPHSTSLVSALCSCPPVRNKCTLLIY